MKQLLVVGNDDDIQQSFLDVDSRKCDLGEEKVNGVCMPRGSLLDITTKTTTSAASTTTSSPATTSKSSATIIGPLDLNLVFVVIFAQAISSLHV